MTIAEVGELIQGLDVPVSPAGLQEAVRLRDALDARIAVAVGEFDADLLGDADCGLHTRAWLQHRTDLDEKSAGRLTSVGRRLQRFGLLREAALAGTISGGQLQIISACVPERHLPSARPRSTIPRSRSRSDEPRRSWPSPGSSSTTTRPTPSSATARTSTW